MRLFKSVPRETDIEGSARCGRCSELLPDETLTFCPKCGVPFSRVPPTTTFETFADQRESRLLKRARWKAAGAGLLAFAAVLGFGGLASEISATLALKRVNPIRHIEFYLRDEGDFPKLSNAAKRQAIAIAVQAFEDHFRIPLAHYTVIEGELPPEIESSFHGPWNPLALTSRSPVLLSVWQQVLYPKLFESWKREPSQPLRVLVTNIPLFSESKDQETTELRHLAPDGLISGLGHPSFVVTSTYRMLQERAEFRKAKAPVDTEAQQARHLGEFIIAHELGHALLGLTDYIVDPPAKTPLRAPASEAGSPLTSTCLMHTDAGGGYAAWRALSERPLGQPSPCHAYDTTVEAFDMRLQAFRLLELDRRHEASELHRQAMDRIRGQAQDWVLTVWSEEHRNFVGPFASIFSSLAR